MNAVMESSKSDSNALPSQPTAALLAVLRQLEEVLAALTDKQYRQKPVGVVASSIGSHVRHCLDHVEALLASVNDGILDYDQRQRGTDVETCRIAALAALCRLTRSVTHMGRSSPATLLWLTTLPCNAGPAVEVRTSLGRELAFVLSHTIHHNALISIMARLLGVAVPDRFGYAPATIAYLDQQACAQ